MTHQQLKIVSLLPSATEIVAGLGLTDRLVGRSHECDYPLPVIDLPACTAPKLDPEGSSQEIHDRVTELMNSALSVYEVKNELLKQLQPTHIITQDQCDVCACSLHEVEAAVGEMVSSRPQIISLQPTVLSEVWADIIRVGQALNADAEAVVAKLQARVQEITNQTEGIAQSDRPTVACIEWSSPLMAAGNWIPELVEMAGGRSLFGKVGQHSPWLNWQDLISANPDIIIFMPCGYDLDRTREDAANLSNHPNWQKLPAVQSGKVYLTDGNSFFNRPGPRLVDSLEILAEILHPQQFQFGYQNKAWAQASAVPVG
ncbi:cobalamin-binding protein [Phormidium sp. CCY1219]|uniref:cobalamin-binding protein n=1 Tax=Phormidium sp. CCY1219 TaxID=2886104 RepID=UPI002D1F1815|nr:cobalamin-binding protein [Phormidium sp. CCY1219]MEB3829086.1 cobalamin-binding protein [Phormidium sp. CCY1219]